jgi:Uma2 family endonuclease
MLATSTKLTYAQFLREYPEDSGRFELINGEFVKMEPIRAHKNIARFLIKTFNLTSLIFG